MFRSNNAPYKHASRDNPVILKSKTYRVVTDNHDTIPMDLEEEPSKVPFSRYGSLAASSYEQEDNETPKSASPVGFDDDLDDADVEELMLRKQLLLSALNQCDSDEDADVTAEEVDLMLKQSQGEEDDEEENALRAALLGSLKSDADEEIDLRSSLIGSLESDMRAALLTSTLQQAPVTSCPPVERKLAEISREVIKEVKAIRSTKVTMSLQEMAATTKYAPKVAPIIIPLGEQDSSSDSEPESSRTVEPLSKKPKLTAPVQLQVAISVERPKEPVNPKNLGVVKRIIAVKQADVARAEQLVEYLKQKLKNAEHILQLNKQQLKTFRDKEAAMLLEAANNKIAITNSASNSPVPSAKLVAQVPVRNSPEPAVLGRPVSSLAALGKASPVSAQPQVFYAAGTWVNFDEFLAAIHLSTISAFRTEQNRESPTSESSKPPISLRWLLLTNEKAPSLDFLRSLLFTNYFHAIVCPYDLSGECKDRKCPYEHIKAASLGADWILMRLVALCPQALGLTDAEMKDKQAVRSRIQNVLSKFHGGKKAAKTNAKNNNEVELVHFVWNLVRNALLAEFNSPQRPMVALSRRVSEACANDESLSILSDQDVNQVVSSLSGAVSTSKKDTQASKRKFVKTSVPLRLRTLCQILRCRPDYSVAMALSACLGEFPSCREQLEAANFLLDQPGLVANQETPSAISHILLATCLFKLNILMTSQHQQIITLGQLLGDEAKIAPLFLVEDFVYLQMVLIHATVFHQTAALPSEFVQWALEPGKRRSLFASNWWSPSAQLTEQTCPMVEKLLTTAVTSCQMLGRQLHNIFTLDQSQLVFAVLAQALTYRVAKSLREPQEDVQKTKKICEKFYAKLCLDFAGKFAAPLTLLLSHQFAHFLDPQQALDFLANSTSIPGRTRQFPSVIYADLLLRVGLERQSGELPGQAEIALLAKVTYDPGDGCGSLGLSEHFFLSLLRVFCADSHRNLAPGPAAFRAFTKSMFCGSLIEKLLVMLSFSVRSLLTSEDPFDEAFVLQMVAPYFATNQPVQSTQKQRYQLIANLLACSLTSSDRKVQIIEKALDSTCLSNEFLLDRLIDSTLSQKIAPDLTYLAGLACRLSCELQVQPKRPRHLMTLACQDATVRLIALLSSPTASNCTPQTRAVVIHSAFRLASCCLVHHPYDLRLWKLLFMCQRSLSATFDPLRMYCRLLTQLGLAAPV